MEHIDTPTIDDDQGSRPDPGPAAVGELAFIAWLLVKAVSVPDRDARVPAMA